MVLFIFSWSMLRKQLRKISIGGDNHAWLIATVFVAGLAGAKIYGLIKYWVLDPNASFFNAVTNSGYGAFGLISFGLGAAALAMKFMKLLILKVFDVGVPLMIIAVVTGRFACFMAGDGCYGPPTDLPWGIAFPNGVKPTNVAVHPTPLYEILMTLPLFYVLSEKKFRNSQPGLRFFLFLFLSSFIRFLMEFWRSTSYPRLLNMTVEQIIAGILLLVFGVILLVFLRRTRSLAYLKVA